MLHAFIAVPRGDIRLGSTGIALPGYQVRVVDESMNPVPPGTVGRLAVRGPIGCRYLNDPDRQKAYVVDGWNLTGDAFHADMLATPMSLPTDAEILAMAESQGLVGLPF